MSIGYIIKAILFLFQKKLVNRRIKKESQFINFNVIVKYYCARTKTNRIKKITNQCYFNQWRFNRVQQILHQGQYMNTKHLKDHREGSVQKEKNRLRHLIKGIVEYYSRQIRERNVLPIWQII
ncbi:unnamed protein product [Paramecium sonneborni]|uniref:Uncharacterized protein n=1 Tax=Paramecium sonneborni TaxID=65129 RepID=A0A8S1RP78_9CILI|nr:unnamed protein product [Paramecium sonneborni]